MFLYSLYLIYFQAIFVLFWDACYAFVWFHVLCFLTFGMFLFIFLCFTRVHLCLSMLNEFNEDEKESEKSVYWTGSVTREICPGALRNPTETTTSLFLFRFVRADSAHGLIPRKLVSNWDTVASWETRLGEHEIKKDTWNRSIQSTKWEESEFTDSWQQWNIVRRSRVLSTDTWILWSLFQVKYYLGEFLDSVLEDLLSLWLLISGALESC